MSMADVHLDARHVEAFAAVMSQGSMTQAAKSMGRTQSTVTRQIQDLEKEIGFELFHRNGRRLTPTEQGVEFYQSAELILTGLRALSDRARRLSKKKPSGLQVAAIPSISSALVPLALKGLDLDLLMGTVAIQTVPAESVVQAVLSRMADVGIASLSLENPGLEVHWRVSFPCVAVVGLEHPFADRERLSASDLADQRLIASSNPYQLRMRINQAFFQHSIRPAFFIETDASYVSICAARAGLGIAIVEAATPYGTRIEGVRAIPLNFDIKFDWCVITAAGRPFSPLTSAFIDQLAKATRTIPGYIFEH